MEREEEINTLEKKALCIISIVSLGFSLCKVFSFWETLRIHYLSGKCPQQVFVEFIFCEFYLARSCYQGKSFKYLLEFPQLSEWLST